VLLIKARLIVFGILNALLAAGLLAKTLDSTPAATPVRACAVLSLSIWFATAACGRLIAYF
jgi:hypothetical protein